MWVDIGLRDITEGLSRFWRSLGEEDLKAVIDERTLKVYNLHRELCTGDWGKGCAFLPAKENCDVLGICIGNVCAFNFQSPGTDSFNILCRHTRHRWNERGIDKCELVVIGTDTSGRCRERADVVRHGLLESRCEEYQLGRMGFSRVISADSTLHPTVVFKSADRAIGVSSLRVVHSVDRSLWRTVLINFRPDRVAYLDDVLSLSVGVIDKVPAVDCQQCSSVGRALFWPEVTHFDFDFKSEFSGS